VDEARPVATPAVTPDRQTVRVGYLVDLAYRFDVAQDAPPFAEDYVVILRVVDEDGKGMWTDEHQPPVPTRQWKPGAGIEYSRPLFVSRRANPGRFDLEISLYSPANGDRLPLAGARTRGRSYRVASLEVTSSGPTPAVAFVKGWHTAERSSGSGNRLGSEWYWSTRESLLWFPNPGRDAQLVLRMDQPIAGDDMTRDVQLHIGDALIDRFRLAPGPPEIKRIPVSADQLGEDEIVQMMLSVDRTVVPAQVPGSGSSDARELGVRVFDAFLEESQGQ
jgi:hypothetical protein